MHYLLGYFLFLLGYYLFCLCSQWLMHNFQILLLYVFCLFLNLLHWYLLVIIIIPFTSMYASLQLHKRDFNIVVSNPVWVLVLYVPCGWLLFSVQFFILINLLFLIFDYYIIILILDHQLFAEFELFSSEFFVTFTAVSLPIKWSGASTVFWTALFEVVLSAS